MFRKKQDGGASLHLDRQEWRLLFYALKKSDLLDLDDNYRVLLYKLREFDIYVTNFPATRSVVLDTRDTSVTADFYSPWTAVQGAVTR